MRATVELTGMHFFAFHGCLESEKLRGNDFTVDVSADYDIDGAASGDDLSKAVDYSRIYATVAARMRQASNLLETVAGDIVHLLEDGFPALSNVKVKVSKKNPPLDGPVEWSSVTAYGSR